MDTLSLDTVTGQLGLFDGAAEYSAFTEKFKAKKTTDDCYTPENVHEAVVNWVEQEYGLKRETFLRPFWPGQDFRSMEYPEECVVVDNPPFSIRAEIISFYLRHGVRFFLYSPALTLITRSPVCHVAVGVSITYENGAEVPTSFVTNLEDCVLRTAPDLYRAVKVQNEINEKMRKNSVPKYAYPDQIITAAIAQRWCHYGIDYRLRPEDALRVSGLDAQVSVGKSIFGGGFLLSERAAAERAAAHAWELSPREWEIVKSLGRRDEQNGTV